MTALDVFNNSAFTVTSLTDAINKGAVYRFLQKPWSDEELKNEIAGALRHWRELHATGSAP